VEGPLGSGDNFFFFPSGSRTAALVAECGHPRICHKHLIRNLVKDRAGAGVQLTGQKHQP